jgi:uncharacterized protein (TIGR00106 family)
MDLSKQKVNVAVQVLPFSHDKQVYDIVDEAIEIIQRSGVVYQVTPFETVMEGEYDLLMKVVKQVQEVCFKAGAENLMCYVKIQSSVEKEATISDKMHKYS